ncbi:Fe-S protein assembly co-chaperone HscB [Psychrobacter aestuarii]|uniref:Co-chaperone protein HscB homolog n=1 Tax=Psychrobacter aestuarii TaxID=556327 RepID=A0ABN0VYZ6_9GAMM|nr:Fe-S protein assembly co-chaperone HscB [Psychrobacter aestuarii]
MTNQTDASSMSSNFFALFEQPVGFEVNQSQLDTQLRVLQKQHHPDNARDTHAQRQAEQTSAVINHAYQTLSHPDTRASYLLEMSGHAHNLEQSIADLDFLDDAMEMRMDLDDALAQHDQTTLRTLHPKVSDRLQTQSARFVTAYDEKAWEDAIDATQKLKFLVKLDADIRAGLDDVMQAAHDDGDDDLYM